MLTYGADTQIDISRTKQLLTTTVMSTLRTIVWNTRRNGVWSNGIRRLCRTENVVKFVRRRRKRLMWQCWQTSGYRLIKIVRYSRQMGKRNHERPQNRSSEWGSTDAWREIVDDFSKNKKKMYTTLSRRMCFLTLFNYPTWSISAGLLLGF